MKCSDISVGEYVRNRYGYIGKYTKNSNGIYEIKIRNGLVCRINSKEEIVKHSKDIIDLIEEGDYVNGCQVMGIYVPRDTWEPIQINVDSQTIKYFIQDEIKSIITKEQIKQIEFKIKE